MSHNYDAERAIRRPWGMQVCECGALFADWAQMRDDHLKPQREAAKYGRRYEAVKVRAQRVQLTADERLAAVRQIRRDSYRRGVEHRLGREVTPQKRYRVAVTPV